MTIAGGMLCDDGILVYADTEWTASTMKIQRGKHWALIDTEGRINGVVAGAGDEDMLRLAIQTWWSALLQIKKPKLTIGDATACLETALHYVYTQHIYPDPNGEDKEFGMIVGISTPDEDPMLFKTRGTALLVSDSYEYVYLGTGSEMAMYLSSRLDVRGVSIAVGELIAAFILWEVKQHIKSCGGASVIYALWKPGAGGKMLYRTEGDIRDYQDYFSAIDRAVQRVRVRTADLEQPEEEFEKKLASFCESLRSLRKIRLDKLAGEKNLRL